MLSHEDAGTTGVGDKKATVEILPGLDGHITLQVERFSFHLVQGLGRNACDARQLGAISPLSLGLGSYTSGCRRACNACGVASRHLVPAWS